MALPPCKVVWTSGCPHHLRRGAVGACVCRSLERPGRMSGLADRRQACCEHCRSRCDDPCEIERRLPGVVSFGTAYGASIAASALCELYDAWVSPEDSCSRFRATN